MTQATENTLLINMLQIENGYQTPIDSNFYHNNASISNLEKKINTISKTPYFKPTLQFSKYTGEQTNFLTMFNFQRSQINQQEFDQLAELLLKYPMLYVTSKLDVGKMNSSLHLSP